LDVLSAAPHRWYDVGVLERPPSESVSAEAVATTGAINDSVARVDHIEEEGEEKVEYKKKEPMFIKGVEFVNLDDCKVPDMRLYCDSDDTNDINISNPGGMDTGDNIALCL
jgi:hypothetical protein